MAGERDVVIIGGGHNGLALGRYLAAAGLDVLVLERRGEFGGGLSTEESTLPGFYHNLHSNFHGILPFFPPWTDFDLPARGVTYFHPEANIGMPLADGRALVLYTDELRSYEEIARFSRADAEAWLVMRGQMAAHLEEILAIAYSPPLAGEGIEEFLAGEIRDWFGQDLWDMTALEFVRSRFENPHVQALLLFHLAVGGWDIRLPHTAGLAVAFLGLITNWQLCRGGSHYLGHVLGALLMEAGGDLREHCHVSHILLENGRAAGVVLADGTTVRARRAVVSTVDPTQTFLSMLDPEDLPGDFVESVRGIRYGHGDVIFGVHLALAEAPRYPAAAFNPDIDRTFNVNIGYETPEDILEHYEEIDRGAVPATPRLEVAVNTLFDPSLAPPGKHTGLIWQFAPYDPEGRGPAAWRELAGEYAQRCIEAWRAYAPNLTPDKVLGVYAYSPHDVATKLVNMRRGGFHCAALTDKQAMWMRPTTSLAGYRTPVPGLYLGGASAHPHGGIVAGPSYNCFQVLSEDLGLKPAWRPKLWDAAGRALRERLARARAKA
ncbi:MAG: NAD(P)/FAD-dependent oxidoreductase [Planctomycetes bacterium]|nr:NAD(P)/FAD-dependent oxidoreductase [Planctomycetota bacterium]